MSVTDLDTPPRKPIAPLKEISDRVTRERAEHPDRVPRDAAPHPVTRAPGERQRARSEKR